MYSAYFVNVITGELFRTSSPHNNKTDIFYPESNRAGWSQIGFDFYSFLLNVQNFNRH